MKKMLNSIFYILKYILYFISLGMTFYIILGMYCRLDKNYLYCVNVFIPFTLLLIMFCINFIKNQRVVVDNIFYNITCVLVFITIILISFRSIFDKNMILNEIMGYQINFYYFSDFIIFMEIMLYGLLFGNVFLVLSDISIKSKDKDDSSDIEVL